MCYLFGLHSNDKYFNFSWVVWSTIHDNHVLTILNIQKCYYSSVSEKWKCVLSKLKQNLATCLSEQNFLRYMYLFELMLVRNI